MRKLVLRGIAERKLRAALSGIAVLLGVAMISGTYIETDQIRNAFDDITEESVEKLDVVVSPEEEFTASMASELPTLPEAMVQRIGQVPGVDAAEGELGALGNIVVDGEVVRDVWRAGPRHGRFRQPFRPDARSSRDASQVPAARPPSSRATHMTMGSRSETRSAL